MSSVVRIRRYAQKMRAGRPAGHGKIPQPSVGWSTGPPDFIGVGVQRAGTTWLYDLLTTHPGIHVNPDVPKELHFFDELVFDADPTKDIEQRYARWFPRPRGQLAGEWTPRYLHNLWTPWLISAAAPRAKLLVSFRDPVERFWSGLEHARRREIRKGASLTAIFADDAAARSRYGAQLRNLLRHVPREQLLVIQYERAAEDPQAELNRIWRFLGLETMELPPAALNQRLGALPKDLPPLHRAEEVEEGLVAHLERDIADFLETAPEIDVGLWRRWNTVMARLGAPASGARAQSASR
jgi:hypothetical protein